MKLLLHTETVIDSCHFLAGYEGKCKNLHGHSWKIEVWIKGDSSQTNEVGILFDFGWINKIKEKYDHKLLNEIEEYKFVNPTAENICETVFKELKEIDPDLEYRVRIYETAVGKETWCEGGDF